ncbi:DUF1501 domain-containing protein [Pirellulaceae bacterium]|jgi:hypothetical protein|nr:DUF1501 domain-containing protein [Pirellulaceae bacterium]
MRSIHNVMTRRAALQQSACGFGSLALAGLCNDSVQAAQPLAAQGPHLWPRAKRIIFLFMQGGPSHVDTYDHKPALYKHDGKKMPFDDARKIANTGKRGTSERVMKPMWKYRHYGESGRMTSDLFRETAKHSDDLTFIHSMHTEGVAHGPATLFLHCGSTSFIRPSFGSWVNYGLGSENENLPGFISLGPISSSGGARNYGSAFLPAAHQGTAIGKGGKFDEDATIKNLGNADLSISEQRRQLEFLQRLNAEQLKNASRDSELEALISSYELAWRMQNNAPGVLDLSQETQGTMDMYGIGEEATDNFGRQCLMARRLCENGVRFVQVTSGAAGGASNWDQHSKLSQHEPQAKAVDKPIAGLLQDLKQRGLLEDTIVWFSGEFGRAPYAQNNGTGRDHNARGFTTWLAGGCLKSGLAYGATDEFGHKAVENKVHMHDLHATLLHLLGLDHEQLTYRYSGRDFRLTDVHGSVVQGITA